MGITARLHAVGCAPLLKLLAEFAHLGFEIGDNLAATNQGMDRD